MNRRIFFLAVACGTSLSCVSAQSDVGWTEEVQLHDGRVIDVQVVCNFERIGIQAIGPARFILRSTTISFAALPVAGHFSQLFEKHRVDMIDYYQGSWFVLLERRGDHFMRQGPTGMVPAWGEDENGHGQKLWRFDGSGFRRASINDLPNIVLRINMLMDYAPLEEIMRFNGKRLTLADKAQYLRRHPLNPGDDPVQRPPTSSAR